MRLLTYDLEMKIRGPFITQSSTLSGYGYDAALAETRGHYFIPGTLVKGLLREALDELSNLSTAWNPAKLREWFGYASGDAEDDRARVDPQRGRIQIGDLLDVETKEARLKKCVEHDSTTSRFRIRMDRDRGSVDKGAFLVIESPFSTGETATFRGRLRMRLLANEDEDIILRALKAGLYWIPSVGAERSVGSGQIESIKIDYPPRVNQVDANARAKPLLDCYATRYSLRLTPTDPLCISRRRTGTNLFESEDEIPGGVIRGAIAAMAVDSAEFQALRENLHLIRVTHAMPVKNPEELRPKRPPLSLCKLSGEGIIDVWHSQKPPGGLAADPAFRIDWKDDNGLPVEYKRFAPKKELRVRTAIEGETRKSSDNMLFAYRVIPPGQCEWIAEIDLSRIVDSDIRKRVMQCLKSFESSGLCGVGKTKAYCDFKLAKGVDPVVPQIANADYLCVTLETPALLVNSRDLAQPQTIQEFKATYQSAWDIQACKGVLELYNFFQSLSMAGGHYLAERFQPGRNYRPYLLTGAGSVFVFKVKDRDAAQKWIEQACRQGLKPLGEDFYYEKGTAEELWKHCPYIAENGYGEIRAEWRAAPAPAEAP